MNQTHSDNNNNNSNIMTMPTPSPMESIYSQDDMVSLTQTETTLSQDHQDVSSTFDTTPLSPVSPFSAPHQQVLTPTSLLATQGDDTNEPSPTCTEAETQLRRKILDIQRNPSISSKDKARQIQRLMWQGTSTSTPDLISCASTMISEGHSITWQDKEHGIMGCQHYQRKCKLQAHCCGKLFSCRFCHDEVSDHGIVRTDTKNMYCMLCETLQPVGQNCVKCDQRMACYYCDKCKLWDDDSSKSVYHCDHCGICRQGQGLGKDFFHCGKCNICMSISMQDKHRCIERNLESDCPICGEYMFTSTSTVIFMPCGHCIHKHCYAEYIQTSYQCPTCLKSLGDMSNYFSRLDRELERQSMPTEYAKFISHIFCNDCEMRCSAKYHFFYHKCAHCASYNTTVLRTENTEHNLPSPPPNNFTSDTTSTEETSSSPPLSPSPSPSPSPLSSTSSTISSTSSSQLSSSPASPEEIPSDQQLVIPDSEFDTRVATQSFSSQSARDHMNGTGQPTDNGLLTSSQQLEYTGVDNHY